MQYSEGRETLDGWRNKKEDIVCKSGIEMKCLGQMWVLQVPEAAGHSVG